MKYHIKLLSRIDDGEYKINLSEEELISRYIEPYIYGETIVINGTTVDPRNLWRIKIFESEDSIDKLVGEIEKRDQLDRSPYKILRGAPAWRAIDQLKDVTDNFINVPPASKSRKKEHLKVNEMKSQNKKNIFIVHGHDTELKNDVELFLKSVDLNPIVLHRELDEGLTVIEKFEKHSDVNYAIILLTPDDIGFTVDESHKQENEREIELRARQNVIFEFGYFIGKLTRRNVCCIYKEGVKLPSDLNGLIYKKVNKSIEEVGIFLMKELRNCGFDVKF
jgi:predicted nucleotide-binding protein